MKKKLPTVLLCICVFLLAAGCGSVSETEEQSDNSVENHTEASESENAVSFLVNRQGNDAYVGLQSAEDNGVWTILKMADYGDWLEKEIRIHIRMTTGL